MSGRVIREGLTKERSITQSELRELLAEAEAERLSARIARPSTPSTRDKIRRTARSLKHHLGNLAKKINDTMNPGPQMDKIVNTPPSLSPNTNPSNGGYNSRKPKRPTVLTKKPKRPTVLTKKPKKAKKVKAKK